MLVTVTQRTGELLHRKRKPFNELGCRIELANRYGSLLVKFGQQDHV